MGINDQLTQNLTSESKAYGYTLCIWGGGTILSHVYHSPKVAEGLLYVVGALVAFALITALTFDRFVVDSSAGPSEIPVPSMVHLIAVLGTLLLGVLFANLIESASVAAAFGFLLVGFQVTATYNLLLPIETVLIRSVFDPAPEDAAGS